MLQFFMSISIQQVHASSKFKSITGTTLMMSDWLCLTCLALGTKPSSELCWAGISCYILSQTWLPVQLHQCADTLH